MNITIGGPEILKHKPTSCITYGAPVKNRRGLPCRQCGSMESRRWNGFQCRDCFVKENVMRRARRFSESGACLRCARKRVPGKSQCEVCLKRSRERMVRLRAEDPIADRIRRKAWRDSNPESVRASKRAEYIRNRESYYAYSRARRALKRNAPGSGLSAEQWRGIIASQHGKCFDCGARERLTVGHLIPLSRGGWHDPSNVAGQCLRCNLQQGTKIHPSLECSLSTFA